MRARSAGLRRVRSVWRHQLSAAPGATGAIQPGGDGATKPGGDGGDGGRSSPGDGGRRSRSG